MASIRSRGNKGTELAMVAILRAAGISGWRRGVPLPGKPDFVFRRQRVCLFVDGCFWHACPRHGTMPKSNRAFWRAKLARNAQRDREVTRELRRLGWRVIRVWEHDLHPGGRARLLARLRRVVEDTDSGLDGGEHPLPIAGQGTKAPCAKRSRS